jgi:O-acetyl-ADP-ribose deacetylase (regulator of RNase III)
VAGIGPHDRAAFGPGDEARGVWDWLEVRERLSDLPAMLTRIDRADLARDLDLLNDAGPRTEAAGADLSQRLAEWQSREIVRLQRELEQTQQRLEAELNRRKPTRVERMSRYRYRIHGVGDRIAGVISGDLFDVRGVDAWVNSENTNMEMARPTDPTISSLIRYYGGRRDDGGHLIEDIIQDELRARMAGRRWVVPGTALATGSGQLQRSHGVKRIIHVATVEGSPAAGYRQVSDVRACLTNALAAVDGLDIEGDALQSVVVPLFGTGVGGADVRTTAAVMANAMIEYLRTREDTRLRVVYLLARMEDRAKILREIFDASETLELIT